MGKPDRCDRGSCVEVDNEVVSAPEESTSPRERLAEARRRLYMPDASASDLAAVVALEAMMADQSEEPPEPVEADQEPPAPDASSRPIRARTKLLLGGTAVVLFVAAAMLVVAQARTDRRQETPTTAAAVVPISLRQLLTRFSSTLPSEWQGAPIVAARERVRGTITLPVSTSATAKQHFLVIRCPHEDGRWSVQIRSTSRPREHPAIGSCGEVGFASLPLGTDTIRVRVEGGQAYAVVVMAHS
jgi:hypothetical protein